MIHLLLASVLLAVGGMPFGGVSNQTATLVVHPAQTYGPASPNLVGGDVLSGSGDFTSAAIATSASTIGYKALRYPQGTIGNCYQWKTNTCGPAPCFINQVAANTLPAFLTLLGSRVGHLIANEATNATCTGGNTTADVQGYVNEVRNTLACAACSWWTVDNEMYNSNANLPIVPLSCPTDTVRAACYKTQFGTFRTAMLAQDSGINVCLDADPQQSGPQGAAWDTTVMAQTFGCADAHYYAFPPGTETDATALTFPQTDFTAVFMAQLKADIAASSSPSAKIVIGEFGTVPSTCSYQCQSIVGALFDVQIVGEAAQVPAVAMVEFHSAVANCTTVTTSSEYGSWLLFSGSQSLSNGLNSNVGCVSSLGLPPAGTVLAPGSGLQVAAQFTKAGETIIKNTLTQGGTDLVAYQSTYGTGYSVMIVNRSQTNAYNVTASIDSHASGAGGQIMCYSKALFDLTNNVTPIWNGPTTSTLAAWTTNFTVTIPAWAVCDVHTG